jgi:hypothetical protein
VRESSSFPRTCSGDNALGLEGDFRESEIENLCLPASSYENRKNSSRLLCCLVFGVLLLLELTAFDVARVDFRVVLPLLRKIVEGEDR